MRHITRYLKLVSKHGPKKAMKHIMSTINVKFKEKSYKHNDINLKYIIEHQDSTELMVVFGACTEIGVKARYNYMSTLKGHKINKLFILDEYGPYTRGCYYLGPNMNFDVDKATASLIESIKKTLNVDKTIYAGSSKGGWAAMYFGLSDKGDASIICGAPQYLLGNYLSSNPTNIPLLKLLEYIVGKDFLEVKQEELDQLNQLISNKIREGNWKGKVYLHHSNKEHTYEDDTKYLVSDMMKNHIDFYEEVLDYEDHSGVSIHYPRFLIDKLQIEIKQ